MKLVTCSNCGKEKVEVKAYVGEKQLPICSNCFKLFANKKISLADIEGAAKSNE